MSEIIDREEQRSIDLKPNNDAYWQSRGEDERPDDWQERIEEEKSQNN